MHWCLPLLKNGGKLVFFSFTNVDPPKLRLDFSFSMSYTTLMWNVMHDLNKSNEDTTRRVTSTWLTRF
jgi:hypothetical protein